MPTVGESPFRQSLLDTQMDLCAWVLGLADDLQLVGHNEVLHVVDRDQEVEGVLGEGLLSQLELIDGTALGIKVHRRVLAGGLEDHIDQVQEGEQACAAGDNGDRPGLHVGETQSSTLGPFDGEWGLWGGEQQFGHGPIVIVPLDQQR